MNGHMEVLAIKIEPSCIDPKDPGMLQDLVTAAVNQAVGKARELSSREMAKVTGGMQMPGLPGML
jgi:DNA-binding YbaB/EbfC family protein